MDDEFVVSQWMAGSLGPIDFLILGGSIVLLFVIAYISGREERHTRDYFIGNRNIPGIVACLSFVATEVSAVTIIGVPAAGFRENWQYLQFFLGSAASRVFIAFLFIPIFYKYNCTTIYEYLRHRFGPETQYTGSIFFFITRLLASGVRLYAACLGVSIIMGWSLVQALILFTIVSVIFIGFGGIKAVVWTGAFSTLFFYAAGLMIVGYLLFNIRGGLAEAWQVAGDAGRLSLFNFELSLSNPTTLWAAFFNAFFVGLCVFGTDHELMQRMLTVKTRKASQRSMLATIIAALPVTCIYLALGTLLYVFYTQNTTLAQPANTDEILSHFVVHVLPTGLKGLILAAIILASIDSPLSSLSSSFVTDIYRPLIKKTASENHYLWVSRFGVIGFGILLMIVAYICQSFEGILWVAFKIIAVTGGSTLGVFLLGMLTNRRGNWSNVIAMTFSAISMAVLLILSENGVIALGWSWLIVIGTLVTFTVGYILGPILKAEEKITEPVVDRFQSHETLQAVDQVSDN